MGERAGLPDLGRLKVVAVIGPVAFLVAFEMLRAAFVDPVLPAPIPAIAATAVLGVCAAAFGIVMFVHIERTQRAMVGQNRDLALVTAVSVAIQGELEADAVVDAALDQIVAATGATEATIVVQPRDSSGSPAREISRQTPDPTADALAAPGQVVEIPLTTGASTIGRLRLHVPAAQRGRLPSLEALQTVGRQLAAGIEIGRLVADLGRRRDEGHVLYQCLLQISNQAPLPEILASITTGARQRLAADSGRTCLSSSVMAAFEDDPDLRERLADEIGCELDGRATTEDPGVPGDATEAHRCGLVVEAGLTLRVPIWIPGERLGEIVLQRATGEPFTRRDHGYLVTLAGIAAIAISAARLRAHERHGVILAERDRIARELHDSLAQVLGSTHLRLRALLTRSSLPAADRRVVDELTAVADVCEEAYQDVREAILGLREASRDRGLLESLRAYIAKVGYQSGIRVELDTLTAGEPNLSTSAEIQVIRVIQEALTNVRKHARATRAEVRVSESGDGDTLTIVVEDDGRGFDPRKTRASRDGGYGVATMRERMELAGGSLRVDSSPGHGTRVIAIVPQLQRRQPSGSSETVAEAR